MCFNVKETIIGNLPSLTLALNFLFQTKKPNPLPPGIPMYIKAINLYVGESLLTLFFPNSSKKTILSYPALDKQIQSTVLFNNI